MIVEVEPAYLDWHELFMHLSIWFKFRHSYRNYCYAIARESAEDQGIGEN